LDSDLRLFRTLDQLVETYDFFIASEDGYSLTNAVIGACKGSPVLERLIDRLDRNEPDWASLPHLTTGPVFFSMNLKWDRTVSVLQRDTFYPYNYDYVGEKTKHRHSYGEHLWVGSWVPKKTAEPANRRVRSLADGVKQRAIQKVKSSLKASASRLFAVW